VAGFQTVALDAIAERISLSTRNSTVQGARIAVSAKSQSQMAQVEEPEICSRSAEKVSEIIAGAKTFNP